MSLYTVLRGKLATGATGALVGTRIYPVFLPQNPTYPALTYQRISNTAQSGSTALRQSRWQVNCYASTYIGAQALAAAVKAELEEWTDTDQTPMVKMCQVVNEIDDYDDEVDVHRVIVDVMIDTIGD
jgi:hypothetical protein